MPGINNTGAFQIKLCCCVFLFHNTEHHAEYDKPTERQ